MNSRSASFSQKYNIQAIYRTYLGTNTKNVFGVRHVDDVLDKRQVICNNSYNISQIKSK